MDKPAAIVDSWTANAGNWIAVIDNAEIESRKLCTNQAIVDTVLSYPLQTILDIGCGEGWLTRALRQYGKQAYGVDVVPALLENAVSKDGDFYQPISYAALAEGLPLQAGMVDAAVLNFSLLDKDDAAALVKSLHTRVVNRGWVFIQTLHSTAVSGVYKTGWRDDSWKGLKRSFAMPYEWYFRTLEDWLILFTAAGLAVVAIKEPLHPETHQPLSFIFVLQIIKLQQDNT